MKIFALNTGGSIGLVGKRPYTAKKWTDLFESAPIRRALKPTYLVQGRTIDANNITNSDRVRMARALSAAYAQNDGFLLLHHADGLVETCAVLSMIFKLSLQKPLIVVGSRAPADYPGSDARMVLKQAVDALEALHELRLVGVYTVSNGEIWHGARLHRRSPGDSSVHTPGMWSLGTIWPRVDLAHGIYQKDFRFRNSALAAEGIQLDTKFEKRVASFKVSADTPPNVLVDAVRSRTIAGAILETRGSLPSRKWSQDSISWIDAVKIASRAGVPVGYLDGSYPSSDSFPLKMNPQYLSEKLENPDVIGLDFLTPAMAEAKFRHALALFPNDPKMIRIFISTNLVGEVISREPHPMSSLSRPNGGVPGPTNPSKMNLRVVRSDEHSAFKLTMLDRRA